MEARISAKSVVRAIRNRNQARQLNAATERLPEFANAYLADISAISTKFAVEPGASVDVWCESVSTDDSVEGAALLELRALDASGTRRPIPGWAFVSTRVGEYTYLKTSRDDEPAITHISIKVPEECPTLEMVGHQWKRDVKTKVLGSVQMVPTGHRELVKLPSGRVVPLRANRYSQRFQITPGATNVRITLQLEGGNKSGKAPFAFRQFDEHGVELLPMADMPQHANHGAFTLVETEAGKQTWVELECTPAMSAHEIEIRGVEWGERTPSILGVPTVDSVRNINSQAADFLSQLSSEDELYLIDTTAPPLGHGTLSLRPNNLAFEYAKLGKKVIFLPFSTIQDQDVRPQDEMLQVNRSDLPRLVEWLAENRRGERNVYVCSSFPNHHAVTLIDMFKQLQWRTVYECRDDMEEFNRVGYSQWYDPMLERRVVESSDLVTAVSTSLASKLQGLTTKDVQVTVTPNGVRTALIDGGTPLRTLSSWSVREQTSIFGYIGHLTDSWFDWTTLVEAANKRPQYIFEIVGHGKPDWVILPNNIKYLGPMSHEEVEPLVSRWRAGLIPFKESPLTRSVDPNKIYEYYAWGLRCITTQMGSVEMYPSTWVYGSSSEFVESLDSVASLPVDADELQTIESFLESCSWSARAEQFVSLVDNIHPKDS